MEANKLQMELYDDFEDSMKPKNSQPDSERQTTAKKNIKRPHSVKKATKQSPNTKQVSIISYVEDIFAKQQKAQRKGKYTIAQRCKSQLQYLKDHLLSQRLKQLIEDQKNDRTRIKQAHENEMMRIQVAWMKLSQSYDRKVQQMIYKWELKKQKQLIRLQKQIQKLSLNQFKIRSKDIKQLQKSKQYYMKIQKYDQVRSIDKEIKDLTYFLFEKVQDDLKNKFIRMKAGMKQKHQKQQNVLKDRIKRAKQQQQIHCNKQKKKLIKKYQNIMKKLQRQQIFEVQSLENNNKPPIQNPLKLSRRNAQWIIENSIQQ